MGQWCFNPPCMLLSFFFSSTHPNHFTHMSPYGLFRSPNWSSDQKTGAPLSIFILINLPDHLCRGVQVKFLTAVLAFLLFKCQQLGSTEWTYLEPFNVEGPPGGFMDPPNFRRSCIKAFASTASTSASFILFLNSHQIFDSIEMSALIPPSVFPHFLINYSHFSWHL